MTTLSDSPLLILEMKLWLVLILLSVVTYAVVQRSISSITKTPVWLCWLVMMFPAFLWTAWTSFYGDDKQIPLPLLLIPLFACPLIYGWLIQMGKPTPENSQASTENSSTPTSDNSSTAPKSPLSSPLRPINNEEETTLRNCFPWNIYYLQNIDYRPQAILCRGKLKTVPEEAYNKIKKNVEVAFGDRFFLIFQESFKGQPFFALVPNPQAEGEKKQVTEPVTRPGIALSLLLMTVFTTTVAGIELEGFTLEQIQSQPEILTQGFLYSIPLLSILTTHELGHYLAAIGYKISCTLPYVIPLPFFLGTLGAFVQKRSPIPHRRALFDIAIAGPIAGLLVTLPILFWGLTQSEVVSLAEKSNLFDFEALDPSLSFLFAVIAKLALGSELKPAMAIHLHPVAIAGYLGLLLTAFNLMPVGQLDGGHIVHAVFGQRMAVAIGQIARILAILFALIHPSFWLWTIILWFMPLLDQPALNDITELNNWRDFCGLLVLGLLLIILLPLPVKLAGIIL
jgi:membrane-associated protease RseP (regulator of RpoE activity)